MLIKQQDEVFILGEADVHVIGARRVEDDGVSRGQQREIGNMMGINPRVLR